MSAVEMNVVIKQHATKSHAEAEGSTGTAVAWSSCWESECCQTAATDADTVRTCGRRALGPGLHGGVKT